MHQRYMGVLTPWLRHAKQHIYTIPGKPELACYGTGYNTWGVQTNQKAFSALAVIATDPNADFADAAMSRDEVLNDALRLLRFSMRSHIEGDMSCLDGHKWGHTWISVLGVERMMHAMEAIDAHLSDADRALFRTVLLSEADWILRDYPVVAGIEAEKNKPESNIWNGAVLHRASMMYPDAANAAAYREKGTRFLLNGLSREEDASSDELFDGRPLREWHVGPNLTKTYGMNHHGYLNVGYMVISLSNLAMLHFSCKARGLEAPKALYHNLKGMWELVRACTFDDGRLLRIGGDTRARYCYCQDFAIPAWLLVEDVLGEDCSELEEGWLAQIEREMAVNNDGSYLSTRCASLETDSPLYYTRLESDRANAFSMGAYWRRTMGIVPKAPLQKPLEKWSCDFHGASFVRSERRAASFVWRAAELPTGLCVPANRSDLAEWRENMAGHIEGSGNNTCDKMSQNCQQSFDGGFVTSGATRAVSEGFIAEGQAPDALAVRKLAFAALPDDRTVVCVQVAEAEHRTYLRSVKGLLLHIPNDLWNGSERRYLTASGERTMRGLFVNERVPVGDWICADGVLSVAVPADTGLELLRGKTRQIDIKRRPTSGPSPEGMLYCDEILAGSKHNAFWADQGDALVDMGFAVTVDGTVEAARLSASMSYTCEGRTRMLALTAADGRAYMLAFNTGDTAAAITAVSSLTDVATGERIAKGGSFALDSLKAKLFNMA